MPKGPDERPFTVYVAGPMSGHPNYNFDAFHEASRRLREVGVVVMSPAETAGQIKVMPRSWYFRFDFAVIANVDAVIVLPEWWTSGGAMSEVIYATEVGVPVYFYREDEFPIGPRVKVNSWDVDWALEVPTTEEARRIRERLVPVVDIAPPFEAFPGYERYSDRYDQGFNAGFELAKSRFRREIV